MKILVINLDRSPERLAHMRAMFSEAGLSFERVPAVDSRELTDEDIAKWRQGVPNFYELRAGEVACFLSHRRCWEIAAANDDHFTVICEDDIYLGRNAAAVLSSSRWIPGNVGIVKLEASGRPAIVSRDEAARIDNRKLHRLHHDTSGSACYLISAACARRLLEKTYTFCDPVDQHLFNSELPYTHGEAVFQLVPAPAIQEFLLKRKGTATLGSTLRGERPNKRRTGLRKIMRELTRPFEKLGRYAIASGMNLFGKRLCLKVAFR